MPLPGGLNTITVFGTFLDSLGNAESGSISFTPAPAQIISPAVAILYPRPVAANLDASGHFSVTLICTDNSPLLPVGWYYTVTEQIAGTTRTYPIYAPHTLGASVDLSTLVPVPTLNGIPPFVPAGNVAPGYGALANTNQWSGSNSFSGAVAFTGSFSLRGVAVTGTPVAGQVLTATSSTAATWQAGGGGGGGGASLDTNAADIQPLGTQAAGAVGLASDAGHVHPMPRLDQVGAPATDVALNNHKITGLFAGSASTDAANVGQLPAAAGAVGSSTTYGQAASVGSSSAYARADHVHGTPALTVTAPATTLGVGTAAALGTATLPALADHVHPMAAAAAPTASAVGDTSVTGVAATFAASDHKHARESFGAVTALAAFGTASANGTSTSVARADHVHGAPSLPAASTATAGIVQLDGTAGDIAALGTQAAGSTGKAADAGHVHPAPAIATAGASAVGDTAAAGSASTYSASDHRHARESFGAVTAQTSYGAASANGAATTLSRSDHAHGTPALPTTAQIGAANRLTPTAVKTAAYTAQAGDLVIVDATSGNVPITLVSAPADGAVIAVKMVTTASSHTATVTCGGTDVYNKTGGATVATLTLTAQAILLQYSAGSGIWYVVGDDLPLAQLDTRYVAKVSPVSLTDGATIATDASLGNLFRVTLGGNRTLSNPTNPTDGQMLTWSLKQDATGSRTITLDTKFRFGTDITSITLTTTASKTDHLGARYNAVDDKFDVVAFVRGF